MKYYLIAGEASGDLHGANLMKALKQEDSSAEFRYLGGNLMQTEGGQLVKHYSEMAFMGFIEVIANLNTILKNLKQAKKDVLAYQPDVLILIDFPGFNLKIADFAKKNGIKIFYYISPKVWAWDQKRVLKIKKVVDRMFCILPFEVAFYKTWGMKVDYVGNPLLDAVTNFRPDPDFLSANHLDPDRPVIAILPGSRIQEVKKILPHILGPPAYFPETGKLMQAFPDYQFVIAGLSVLPSELYQPYHYMLGGKVIYDQTYDLLHHAQAAIVTSGTATLETALFKVPQVVVYRANALTFAIARLLIKIQFISLVNLIMDKEVVKELIQQNCTVDKIMAELEKIVLDSPCRTQMLANYDELATRMGEAGASLRAAKLMVRYLKNTA